ncbi:MAG TPA: isoprenylcysteine carboxylmethyltransferase family protein [Bryobacteraceae bacterium]|jgi:protein-S-isoprenylcysteine O-methyltransferase|nr:isoprenylcysteine carboxylmethyltransferase family protein [Bryobacteraceae bacterium]
MGETVRALVGYAWLAVGIIWLAAAFGTKRAARRYIGRARIVQVVLLVTAFTLVFYRKIPLGALDTRFIPRLPAVAVTGAAFTFAGLLMALWARFFLGRNWSGEITVKQDHQLVRTGPYAIVRHPIYSGFLLALLGTALVFGQVRCFVGLGLAAVGWRLKSLVEEQYMTEQFGAEYMSYRQQVKALVPFIW